MGRRLRDAALLPLVLSFFFLFASEGAVLNVVRHERLVKTAALPVKEDVKTTKLATAAAVPEAGDVPRRGGEAQAAAAPPNKERGAAAAALTSESPAWMVPNFLAKAASDCKCHFHGSCSCEQSMEFMDCIADACASGKCDCEPSQYRYACMDMSRVCTNLDFDCSHNRAVCASEVYYNPRLVTDMTKAEVLEELKELKGKKCKLEVAHEKGWLNADRRLEEINGYITDRLEALEAGGAATPWMGCGPEIEAEQIEGGWHDNHKKFWLEKNGGNKDAKAGVSGFSCPIAALLVAFMLSFHTVV